MKVSILSVSYAHMQCIDAVLCYKNTTLKACRPVPTLFFFIWKSPQAKQLFCFVIILLWNYFATIWPPQELHQSSPILFSITDVTQIFLPSILTHSAYQTVTTTMININSALFRTLLQLILWGISACYCNPLHEVLYYRSKVHSKYLQLYNSSCGLWFWFWRSQLQFSAFWLPGNCCAVNLYESIKTDSCITIFRHSVLCCKTWQRKSDEREQMQECTFKIHSWPGNLVSKITKTRNISTLTIGSICAEAAFWSTALLWREKKRRSASRCRPAFSSASPAFKLDQT